MTIGEAKNILYSYVEPLHKHGLKAYNFSTNEVVPWDYFKDVTICSLIMVSNDYKSNEDYDYVSSILDRSNLHVYVYMQKENGVYGIGAETFGEFGELDHFTFVPFCDPDSFQKVADFILKHHPATKGALHESH